MSTKNFDLIVIGTGVAGLTVAYKCRSAGWKVAVVDSQPFGGTCALRGCDPKKVLVGAAELVDWNRRMKDRGVSGSAVIDWPCAYAIQEDIHRSGAGCAGKRFCGRRD